MDFQLLFAIFPQVLLDGLLLMLKATGGLEVLSPFLILLLLLLAGMAVSGLLAVAVERVAYRPLRGTPRLIPLISAIGVSFFLQDAIRFVESIWRNAFNLVYPTMTHSNNPFRLTQPTPLSGTPPSCSRA